MWPFSTIKNKIVSLTRTTVKMELEGESITFLSAKALVEMFDMRLARIETEALTRIDDLEQQVESLKRELGRKHED